jgi:uncharacterized protein
MKTTTTMNFLMKLFMAIDSRMVSSGRRRWFFAALLLCLTTILSAQSEADVFPPKPEPAVYVHDYAGWLAPGEKATLEQKLRTYWDSTSTQIVVMIRPDIGDYDKASYAFELGNRWGVGRKDKNNGVIMLIKSEPPERGIFIATGYGTEGALPDITAGRIIRNTMGPFFRQQQYYQGIDAGLNDIIRALAGEFKDDAPEEEVNGSMLIILLIVFLCMFGLMGFIFYRVRKGMGTMYTHDGKGRSRRNDRNNDGGFGGGWWIGGGGFGGDGGSSGGWGGGSSGGDFGGGSFGGGGAGGDW